MVKIREMNVYDIPTVFDIGERVFTSEYSSIYRFWDEYEVTKAFSSEGEFCLVALVDNKTVGFVIGTLIEKGTAWNYGYIVWFGIDPEFQRLGVGAKLLKVLKKRFVKAGARIMLVDTQSENKRAFEFFKKHHFTQSSEHVFLSCLLTKKRTSLKRRQ